MQQVRHAASRKVSTTQHDRQKRHLIAESAPFLRHVGISTDNGTVRPNARDKFRQVQQFVGILDHLVADHDHATPLRIVDLGCGSGVLTLAAHHHLMASGVNVHTIGIDLKGKLMAQLNSTVEQLGWSTIEFVTEAISQWQPKPGAQPDLVIALHACDTATDDAIAQAVAWKSSHLLVAPCCQHDLQRQIDQSHIPPGFESLVRHGIVRERLGDLLTDTFRADVLAALGWRTDVIEFVDNQHTAKNIMIRASQTGELDEPARHVRYNWRRSGRFNQRSYICWRIDQRRNKLGECKRPNFATPAPSNEAAFIDEHHERESGHPKGLSRDER